MNLLWDRLLCLYAITRVTSRIVAEFNVAIIEFTITICKAFSFFCTSIYNIYIVDIYFLDMVFKIKFKQNVKLK